MNAMTRPSLLIAPEEEDKSAWVPVPDTLTRAVAPATMSHTKISFAPFVSPGTSPLLVEENTT
jgi:hypothetical protein